MTQELINKLIKHYEKVIEEIKDLDFEEAISVCEKNDVDCGICNCSKSVFGENLYYDTWVLSKRHAWLGYFNKIPKFLYSKEEILDSLQYRIDIMKTFPK